MMNKSPTVNQTTIHILYTKYKSYFVSSVVIIMCFFMIWFIILPQFQNWSTMKTETSVAEEKLQALNKSLVVISRIDTETLNNNLRLTTKALPADKDFSAIMNTITNAAITSSVILDDYTFQVGDLGLSQKDKDTYLQLRLIIKGNFHDVDRFISTLEKQLPLSSVTDIQINNDNSAQLTLIFYYEPFPKLTFDTTKTLEPLTSKEEAALQELQQRNNFSNE